jgi:hypothetical protein
MFQTSTQYGVRVQRKGKPAQGKMPGHFLRRFTR